MKGDGDDEGEGRGVTHRHTRWMGRVSVGLLGGRLEGGKELLRLFFWFWDVTFCRGTQHQKPKDPTSCAAGGRQNLPALLGGPRLLGDSVRQQGVSGSAAQRREGRGAAPPPHRKGSGSAAQQEGQSSNVPHTPAQFRRGLHPPRPSKSPPHCVRVRTSQLCWEGQTLGYPFLGLPWRLAQHGSQHALL